MRNIATAAALRNEEGGLGEGLREKEGKEERGRKGETTRRRSDGVINDRVFNTLYGLAYKLRAVHRSSWQRINGRGAEHAGGSLRSLAFSFSISRSLSLLPSFVLILPLRAACNRSPLPASRAVHGRASYCFVALLPPYRRALPFASLVPRLPRRAYANESLIRR